MNRKPTLSDLSAGHNDHVDFAVALEHAERVRNVHVDGALPASFRKLRRVFKLRLRGPLPKDLGPLRSVRALTLWGDDVKKLPEAIFALPHLGAIYEARALVDREAAMARLAEKARANRKLAPPSAKAALIKALQNDDVADGANLKGVDLSGATFEDLWVTHDLTGAKLANTTWRRCDFARAATHRLDGVDLTNAVFEDCVFRSPIEPFTKVKAPGVRFVRCSLDLKVPGADLRGAELIDLAPSPSLAFDKANATGMKLDAVFDDEAEIDIQGKGADLSGAHIRFDVVPERREELSKKRNAQLKWAKDQFRGAKTNAETKIEYAELLSAKASAKDAGGSADALMKGPRAKLLGTLSAVNGACWALIVDAAQATHWTGRKGGDFDRAMAVGHGKIKVNGAPAVIAEIGDCGSSHVWLTPGGDIVLVALHRSGRAAKMKQADFLDGLAARVAAFPVAPKPKLVGRLEVESGALALVIPYRAGDFKPAQLASTAKSKKPFSDPDGSRVVLPVESGSYAVWQHRFGPSRDYEDELGTYGDCIRITPK